MNDDLPNPPAEESSRIARLVDWCLRDKLVVFMGVLLIIGAALVVAPFDWDLGSVPRHPVSVDAIPDTGENQQIVFTAWPGRSPKDVDDQISYPLTTQLQGIKDVRTVRSISMFGFSSIYVIFEDGVDFFDSRTRLLEKLASLPPDIVPDGVRPQLGPDATAMGQVFWYTLEGRDADGKPAGGWDLEELRTVQDWHVRDALQAGGVAEVASVGGFVREYQVDVDPDLMRHYGVTLDEVLAAVKASNLDVGAETIELNNVDYYVRGVGLIKKVSDIEQSVVKVVDNVPVLVSHVATVSLGKAERRGALDKNGAPAVGGVVVARYGANPLDVIKNVKARIEQIAPYMPKKTLEDGTVSQVAIVPFYDRTGLIYETLGTLNSALEHEILITIIVVILMVMHLRSAVLITGMLPLAVLLCFIAMKIFGVEANVVALSGIAIAIGTIVDMGIVLCENILVHLDAAGLDDDRIAVIRRATAEVGSAITTAVLTTVVSFLPVFVMTGAEGKLFKPLAYTKTFALIASIVIALVVLPPAAHLLFARRVATKRLRVFLRLVVIAAAMTAAVLLGVWPACVMGVLCAFHLVELFASRRLRKVTPWASGLLSAAFVVVLLSEYWQPLGSSAGVGRNIVFVVVLVGGLLGLFRLFQWVYPAILGWCLAHKVALLSVVGLVLLAGLYVFIGPGTLVKFWAWIGRSPWTIAAYLLAPAAVLALGAWAQVRVRISTPAILACVVVAGALTVPAALTWSGTITGKLPDGIAGLKGRPVEQLPPDDDLTYLKWVLANDWTGRGEEFMPRLDEGSFLWMPVLAKHADIGVATDLLADQDAAFENIPEVEMAVGKIGRVASPLDPAPISMYETVIIYKPKSQWRPHIKSSDDIWQEILRAGSSPAITPVTRLQPIETRRIMLQTGMRATMGVRIQGANLAAIEDAAVKIETLLKDAPPVKPRSISFVRMAESNPYITITPDRSALTRYGIKMADFQRTVSVAIGGMTATRTVEDRRRFAVRVRYKQELRDSVEAVGRIIIPGAKGQQVPLAQLAAIDDGVKGPEAIKSEDTFKTAYVTFAAKGGWSEVQAVEEVREFLAGKQDAGRLDLPADVSYGFAGTYEQQVRSADTLKMIIPLALLLIFVILYVQFRSAATTGMVFFGIFVAWAGGFLMIWLYGQPWFLDFAVFDVNMRDLFQVHPINLSVAVWVGFLALFGIASDDGVVMATYLTQSFDRNSVRTIEEIRATTIAAGTRRVRPCLMTTATTILALIPVLTSTGRGSDIMVPMAVPSFGGMLIEVLTMLVVPVLYCLVREMTLKASLRRASPPASTDTDVV